MLGQFKDTANLKDENRHTVNKYRKPIALFSKHLKMAATDGTTIADVTAGSGTTAVRKGCNMTTAPAGSATTGAHADDEEELDLNYEEMDTAMEVDTTQASQPAIAAELASHAAETHQLLNPQRLSIQPERHPSQPTPTGKGKTATAIKLKKKQPKGRSRSDGATRNRSKSKPRLSGTRGSDSEWETYDDADQPSSSSHQ
eukprot:jgi/Tetstr1/445026/TSEL_032834.t1